MRAVVETAALKAALSQVKGVVARSAIPILTSLLIKGGEEGLSLTGTDMELALTVQLGGVCPTDFAAAAGAAHLAAAAATLDAGSQAELALSEQALVLTSGSARFTLPVLPPEDFPRLDTAETPCRFTLPGAAVARAIGAVQAAIATESTRHYLCGAFLTRPGDETLRLVAANGPTLHRVDLPAPEGFGGMAEIGPEQQPGVILPSKTCAVIKRVFADSPSLEMAVGETLLVADDGRARLVSRLIDGNFPDYARVIPASPPSSGVITLPRARLVSALERCAPLGDEDSKSGSRVVVFRFGSTQLIAASHDVGAGTLARDEIEIAFEGKGLDIAMVNRYLRGALLAFDGDEVLIEINGPLEAITLRDPGDPSKLAVVMPYPADFPKGAS